MTAITVVVAVGAFIAAGMFYISHVESGFGECTAIVRKSIPSPNGSKYIAVFGTECGATVGFNTQLSIVPIRSAFSYKENPAFFIISDKYDVTASWSGEDTVEIVVPSGAKILKKEGNIDGITVRYK